MENLSSHFKKTAQEALRDQTGGRDCLCSWDWTAKNTPSEIDRIPRKLHSETERIQ